MIAAAVAGVAVGGRTRRLAVEGPSMRPTLEPGDRVVAVRLGRPRPGHLAALADPRAPARTWVKRVAAVGTDGTLDVRGDDPAASTDSRAVGRLAATAWRGRVVWRYAPAERAGRLR